MHCLPFCANAAPTSFVLLLCGSATAALLHQAAPHRPGAAMLTVEVSGGGGRRLLWKWVYECSELSELRPVSVSGQLVLIEQTKRGGSRDER